MYLRSIIDPIVLHSGKPCCYQIFPAPGVYEELMTEFSRLAGTQAAELSDRRAHIELNTTTTTRDAGAAMKLDTTAPRVLEIFG